MAFNRKLAACIVVAFNTGWVANAYAALIRPPVGLEVAAVTAAPDPRAIVTVDLA